MDPKEEYSNPPHQQQHAAQIQPQEQTSMPIQQEHGQQDLPHDAAVTAAPKTTRDPRSEKWQFGLFDCFGDMEGSLIACFLPCMLHGRTMDRIKDPSLESHDPLNNECILWCGIQCVTGCGCLYNMVKRTEIRKRYGIQGSGGSDCCTSYCCLCCALVQQDREVALRAGHHGGGPVTQAYQAQKEEMQMPSQQLPPPNPPRQQNEHHEPTPPSSQQQHGLLQQPVECYTPQPPAPAFPHDAQHEQKQQ
ncbi:hypothetical protein E4U21_003960 [Claviceps maximensis]|nr:hypothetical protein E4U21_003960 [Claviceps maximensis]